LKFFLPNILILITAAVLLATVGYAQTPTQVQLKNKLQTLKEQKNYQDDTAYFNTVNKLASLYTDSYPDTALLILKDIVRQCKTISYHKGEVMANINYGNAFQTKGNFDTALQYYNLAYNVAVETHYKTAIPGILGNIALIYLNQGNYPVALQKFYASISAAEAEGNKLAIRNSNNNIGEIYFYQGKMKQAEDAYTKTLETSVELKDTANVILSYNNIAEVNLEENELAKALQNLTIAYQMLQQKSVPNILAAVTNSLGDCYYRMDSTQKATDYFETSLGISKKMDNARATCKALIGLAKVKSKLGLHTEALQYGLEAVEKSKTMGQAQLQRDALKIVSEIYEQSGDGMNAIKYYKEYKKYSDSLVNIENERMTANLRADYELSKKEEEFQRKTLQQRWIIFSALAALFTTLIIIWVVYRNKKRLSGTYKELQYKSHVIEGQKQKAEETLAQLKETQTLLIHSEKMASLGELTAGIAHEIQNPLNFVNNFSEVSNELIEELKIEKEKPTIERDEQLENEILNDIKSNLEKINHHGKRADAIVKGMLQHSRSSAGAAAAVKEPTDINKLADEYLRLSYHGLRAKDKSFNATIKTDFDESLKHINIIPQDIGRVILNLLTNAFYAVNERKKEAPQPPEGGAYEPMVSISTHRLGDHIEIKVADNGNGIPDAVKEKIFQPFFTTKPSGSGTGLGLSMSYDIVKAHGGAIKVISKDGHGTEFIISLPLNRL
jgi:two-component system NtrC family sensor kinase